MTTNFPSGVDAFTNPTSADTLDNPPHDQQHADINDAMEAVQTSLLDGAPLHIDDANERVGIGDTTPSYKLDVNGDVNATGDLRIKGTAIGDWQDYTPSLTNISGTVEFAKFCEINQLVVVHFSLTLDAAVTGTIEISAPTDLAGVIGGTGVGQIPIGYAIGIDSSASNYRAPMFVIARGTNLFRFMSFLQGSAAAQAADADEPFTWASGDSLRFTATYERDNP